MKQALGVAATFLGILSAVVLLVWLTIWFSTVAEQASRESECFDAGGRIVNGACMPVENAINLETTDGR